MPQGRHFDLNPFLGQTFTQLCQGHVRPGFNPATDIPLPMGNARTPMPPYRQAVALATDFKSLAHLIHPQPADFITP
ncbi:hypothetical protein SAMN05216414_12620, partial [Nitrosovibrio sp. Nv17]